jgi:hypothetical protein
MGEETMTYTEFNDPKTDRASWAQCISGTLDQILAFCREAGKEIGTLARKALFRGVEETRFFFSRLTTVDFVCGGLTLTTMFVASLFLLSGLGLVSYQVFLWLKDGIWPEFPVAVAFNFLFENTVLYQWLSNPKSWFGLQKVTEWLLENIPLSLALIVPAVATIGAMICVMVTALAIRYYQFKNNEEGQP